MSEPLPYAAGAKFDAKFDGRCKNCDQAVYIGDRMQYIDDEAVCKACGDEAVQANHETVRRNAKAWEEAERAKDPEKYDRQRSAAKAWVDSVKARAAQEGNKEWVTAPGGATGWVRNPDHQPGEPRSENEQEDPMAVEPGIQALMAAGLIQGQEPGGDGVCHATIEAAGIVTEVDIPVPAAAVPSVDSAGGPAAVQESPNTARLAELQRAADAFLPGQVEADVLASRGINVHGPAKADPVPAPPADALQSGLQAAVDSGAMSPNQAAALGWVAPGTYEAPWLAVSTAPTPSPWVDPVPDYHATQGAPPAAATPRTMEPLAEFRADPSTTRADIFLDALAGARSVAEEDAVLAALDSLPAYVGETSKDVMATSLKAVIVDAIENHPRSLQVKIGPSEIGTECDHCLAAKLAGWREVRGGEAWLPTVGTAVHSWLQQTFDNHPEGARGTRRYLTERRVSVGEIDGVEITGSTDLVDVVAGWTWDWKIVGPTTLKAAKVKPSRTYVVQQMLYARGWRRLGVNITHVGIAYLPRNAVSLNAAVWWGAPYDEQLAVDALARADGMARNIRALRSIGEAAVASWISGLPRWREVRREVNGVEVRLEDNALEGRIVCLDCPRYEDYPEDPGAAMKQLEGLL